MSNAARRLPQLPLDDTDLPALIVLGRDDGNKPHAAWFDSTEAVAGREAAKGMGMMALAVTTDDVRKLADQIAHGKIFASGKAFVPFTKAATYDALIVHVPVAEQVRPLRIVRATADTSGDASDETQPVNTPASAEKSANDGSVLTVPQDWSKVGPGCVVLAVADDKTEGWFEAVIIKAKGTTYTLRWRDYPQENIIERAPVGLALMHPSRKATD